MKIALVAAREILEIKELRKELSSRGHETILWPLDDLTPEQFVNGQLAEAWSGFDLIYYRSGMSDAGIEMLPSLLAGKSDRLVNQVFIKHPLSRHKIYQAFAAIKEGLPVPAMFIGRNIPFTKLAAELGLPFIFKGAQGIQGNKVFLVSDEQSYTTLLGSVEGDVLMQKFIQNDGDYRVFTIGGDVYQIFKRVAKDGSFKNNMSLGAKGEEVTDQDLRKRLGDMATTIVRALDIEIGGVDIIESAVDGSLFFLEVNVNPGWAGLDATLGTNTAAAIADYFESRVKSSNTASL
ncbi:hypothetical protein A2392_03115 [Candidatus Kaiserbacteria bacterium RIFOXYB1_FULL_46_14]|uniref:ATP-grasp domain-containing protein n=1 Tax=Candidatus Kaiserbacteria bacterium RIFOXYB1_FULL_46_14 TaxID=1798531 RepID=A0A1F6FIR9_9BACT|nr:MAG: hypothetical protein A2392_03115 [Candidatus Kaiserbacteria bacterium RIFOXYB1_FULL_46_14]